MITLLFYDGLTIVAVARALGEPKSMQDIDLAITDEEEKRISYRTRREYMVGVKVKIVDLKKTERFIIDHRWTFSRLNPMNAEQVINLYNTRD